MLPPRAASRQPQPSGLCVSFVRTRRVCRVRAPYYYFVAGEVPGGAGGASGAPASTVRLRGQRPTQPFKPASDAAINNIVADLRDDAAEN